MTSTENKGNNWTNERIGQYFFLLESSDNIYILEALSSFSFLLG